MTSPRQRKKRAAFLARQQTAVETAQNLLTNLAEPLALEPQPVVVSEPVVAPVASKPKKATKTALVEKVKEESSQDQVIEQTNKVVNTDSKE
jgi:hypothetical protein